MFYGIGVFWIVWHLKRVLVGLVGNGVTFARYLCKSNQIWSLGDLAKVKSSNCSENSASSLHHPSSITSNWYLTSAYWPTKKSLNFKSVYQKIYMSLEFHFFWSSKIFRIFLDKLFALTPNSEVNQNLHKTTKMTKNFGKIFQNWSFPYFLINHYLLTFLQNLIFLDLLKFAI